MCFQAAPGYSLNFYFFLFALLDRELTRVISMKTVAAMAVVLPLMLGVGNAFATIKIAVVQSAALVQDSPQYLAAQASIKSEFGRRKAALDAQAQKLAGDIQTFKKNADVMTPDEQEQKQNELITRQNDLKFQENKFRQDLQTTDREKTKQLMDQIKSVIASVAKQEGYDLVLEDPVYAASHIDITDDVLKRLKSESTGK